MTGTQARGGLRGLRAVVTGAGSVHGGLGNGRATAVLLAREGACVHVVDRDVDSARETVDVIESEGGTARAHEADVADEADCARVCGAVAGQGQVAVLVNNVGVMGGPTALSDLDLGEWDRILRTNVTAAMVMAKHLAPAMPRGGAIVNLSSLAAHRVTGRLAYATSKAAVEGLTVALAGELGPSGIRVNAVCPGSVWTPVVDTGDARDAGAARRQRVAATLLGEEGTAWDTAHAVRFLAGPEARWITGQVLVVDGGASARLAGVT
ncbi:glucose 1-dehydrogenase [Pseudonocardia ailaonensis]|uniref:Glucose 1-dehydrogenase n=1 Tax=Pseudonocardia ailaonensis TaxID=367279 RepID=A0ABN2N693_9PSEU